MTRRCSHCGQSGHNARTCSLVSMNDGADEDGEQRSGSRCEGSSEKMDASADSQQRGQASPSSLPQGGRRRRTGTRIVDGDGSDSATQSSQQPREQRKKGAKKGVPWTEEEHKLFLMGLQKLGKGDWRGISRHFVQTRTPTQVASHAQKYFIRKTNLHKRKRRSSLFDLVPEPEETAPSELADRLEPQDAASQPLSAAHLAQSTYMQPYAAALAAAAAASANNAVAAAAADPLALQRLLHCGAAALATDPAVVQAAALYNAAGRHPFATGFPSTGFGDHSLAAAGFSGLLPSYTSLGITGFGAQQQAQAAAAAAAMVAQQGALGLATSAFRGIGSGGGVGGSKSSYLPPLYAVRGSGGGAMMKEEERDYNNRTEGSPGTARSSGGDGKLYRPTASLARPSSFTVPPGLNESAAAKVGNGLTDFFAMDRNHSLFAAAAEQYRAFAPRQHGKHGSDLGRDAGPPSFGASAGDLRY